MMPELDFYYLNQKEHNKSCLFALRSIIIGQNPNITETQKYGMPCFCFNKKVFCYLWTDKKTDEPYILFVNGNEMNHPDLEAGERKKMKIYRIIPTEDLPKKTIELLLKTSINQIQ
jgi:Domain of unknown function (DU1801)